MTPTGWLLGYATAVVAITFVHVPAVLGGLLALGVITAGTARWQLLKRAGFAILAFNLTVSLGYALVAGLRGEFVFDYLLLVNLRVLLLVFLGFWFVRRVNLIQALSFAPAWPGPRRWPWADTELSPRHRRLRPGAGQPQPGTAAPGRPHGLGLGPGPRPARQVGRRRPGIGTGDALAGLLR
jgi:cytochrome c biogenesis protein CcdA